MALFRAVTFFIHAIVSAMASMLVAVFTHVIPAILAIVLIVGGGFALCTTCGLGSFAVLRKRGKTDD